MIRVTHRVSNKSAVSGGLFATALYVLFVWPFVLMFWAVVLFGWAFWQLVKLAMVFVNWLDHGARRN